jgi:DHA1 family bicyclomycin/chloramphenicol resistance-like MFS transporter
MSGPRFPSLVGSRPWIAALAALTAVVALSIDMSLPAQPTLAARFAVDDEVAGLTLSTFIIGFAGAQIFVGYLSDAWGRRPVLIGGLVLFTLAGIACTLSPSIELLIAFRIVQGVGAAAAPVVARAMVRDTQPAAQAARLMSTMLAALAVAPMIAPLIGGALLRVLDWPAIFAAIALTGAIMLAIAYATLVETLPPERRKSPSLRDLFGSYRRFFATRGTRLPMLVACASFAGQFAYIADSPFVIMGGYGVSPDAYGLYFGSTAVALMLGSIIGGRMLGAGRPPRVMIVAGATILAIGGVLVVAGTQLDVGIAGFLAPMIIYFFGSGMTHPSAIALAMEPVPEIAGTASAAIGCSIMVSGAVAGYETTRIGGTSPTMFAIVAGVMSAIALLLAVMAARR